ncbi:cysteine desulfurase family protein [Zymobacter sp. IVIA_12111.31 C1]|uniref:cysteine desulfurase family protein n=1 Tax=Zymobacter sp. IVIA_12111.31 C1 TaxID=3394854 RepID=UPI0039C3127E
MQDDGYYLDHMASSPMLSVALEAMWPWMVHGHANPSSPHDPGQQVRAAVEQARRRIAAVLGVQADELIFTASGSEANNLAVKGLVLAGIQQRPDVRRIITTPLEHASTRAACAYLARWHSVEVEEVAVDAYGLVCLDDLRQRLQRPATLCSIVLAHNEIGTVQPLAELALCVAQAGIPLHIDAVQTLPWGAPPLAALPIAAASFSGHKVGAGKGIGALYLRRGTAIEPLIHGGHQEQGRRGGTETVAQIVGLAAALQHLQQQRWPSVARVAAQRQWLVEQVLARCRTARLTGHPQQRLPGHASFLFPGLHGGAIQQGLNAHGVYCSGLAACGGAEPPPQALLALGVSPEEAQSALRIGLDGSLSDEQLAMVVRLIVAVVREAQLLQTA